MEVLMKLFAVFVIAAVTSLLLDYVVNKAENVEINREVQDFSMSLHNSKELSQSYAPLKGNKSEEH